MNTGGSQGLRQRPYRMRARAQAAQATAQAIIAAARVLFAERPYDQVSLPVIAERAGVTVQTVLRRFGSKEELFAAAAQRAVRPDPRRPRGRPARRRHPPRRPLRALGR